MHSYFSFAAACEKAESAPFHKGGSEEDQERGHDLLKASWQVGGGAWFEALSAGKVVRWSWQV